MRALILIRWSVCAWLAGYSLYTVDAPSKPKDVTGGMAPLSGGPRLDSEALAPALEFVGAFLGRKSTKAEILRTTSAAPLRQLPRESFKNSPHRGVQQPAGKPNASEQVERPVLPVAIAPGSRPPRPQLRTLLFALSDSPPQIVAPTVGSSGGSIDAAIADAFRSWQQGKLTPGSGAEQIVKAFQNGTNRERVKHWRTAASFLRTLARPEWASLAAFMQTQSSVKSSAAIPFVQDQLAGIFLSARLQATYPSVFGPLSGPRPKWLPAFLAAVLHDDRLWVRDAEAPSETLKAVFERYFKEGRTMKVTAAQLGLSISSVDDLREIAFTILRARGVAFRENFDPARTSWNEPLQSYPLVSGAHAVLQKHGIETVGALVSAVRHKRLPLAELGPYAVMQIQKLIRANGWLSLSERGMPDPLDESVHGLPFTEYHHRLFNRMENGPIFTYRQLIEQLSQVPPSRSKWISDEIYPLLYRAGLLPSPSRAAAKRLQEAA